MQAESLIYSSFLELRPYSLWPVTSEGIPLGLILLVFAVIPAAAWIVHRISRGSWIMSLHLMLRELLTSIALLSFCWWMFFSVNPVTQLLALSAFVSCNASSLNGLDFDQCVEVAVGDQAYSVFDYGPATSVTPKSK